MKLRIAFKLGGIDYGIMWLNNGDLALADSYDFLLRMHYDPASTSMDQFIVDFLQELIAYLKLEPVDMPTDNDMTIEQKREKIMEDLYTQLKPVVENHPTSEGISLTRF